MSERRLLIVDDDELIRELAITCLELQDGWVIEQAESGMEAVVAASSKPPDAILLDVMMPEWDGPQTLEKLRAVPNLGDVPVIFLTAKTGRAERQRYSGLNVMGTIAKPFEAMELASQIAEILGWPH